MPVCHSPFPVTPRIHMNMKLLATVAIRGELVEGAANLDPPLLTMTSSPAEPQVLPDEAEARESAEAKPPHSSVDSPPNWQHDQVWTSTESHIARLATGRTLANVHLIAGDCKLTEASDIMRSGDTGERLVSASECPTMLLPLLHPTSARDRLSHDVRMMESQ
jgi:hypothetical protein